eukprot:SAG11_NODE_51_length_19848_cov_37.780698_8_plen_83_part_00
MFKTNKKVRYPVDLDTSTTAVHVILVCTDSNSRYLLVGTAETTCTAVTDSYVLTKFSFLVLNLLIACKLQLYSVHVLNLVQL